MEDEYEQAIKKARANKVTLTDARDYDIARRVLIGGHKKAIVDKGASSIDTNASELQPFEYDKRIITMTQNGSLHSTVPNFPYRKVCQIPDGTYPNNQPGLPVLPPGFMWTMYKQPDFLEAGKIILLRIKGQYPTGKALMNMHFILSRKEPTNVNFDQSDIILQLNNVILAPIITGFGFGDWALWYDRRTDVPFTYPYTDIRQDIGLGPQGNVTDLSLYIICENWQGGPPYPSQMQVEMLIEDRGR